MVLFVSSSALKKSFRFRVTHEGVAYFRRKTLKVRRGATNWATKSSIAARASGSLLVTINLPSGVMAILTGADELLRFARGVADGKSLSSED